MAIITLIFGLDSLVLVIYRGYSWYSLLILRIFGPVQNLWPGFNSNMQSLIRGLVALSYLFGYVFTYFFIFSDFWVEFHVIIYYYFSATHLLYFNMGYKTAVQDNEPPTHFEIFSKCGFCVSNMEGII